MPKSTLTLRLVGTIPSEAWNRFGAKIVPKLRGNGTLQFGVDCSISIDSKVAVNLTAELKQILSDLGLDDAVKVETRGGNNGS